MAKRTSTALERYVGDSLVSGACSSDNLVQETQASCRKRVRKTHDPVNGLEAGNKNLLNDKLEILESIERRFDGRAPQCFDVEPWRCSTVDLAGTCDVPREYDNETGHFMFKEGDYLTAKYKIVSQLGKGTFAKVVECLDVKQFVKGWKRKKGHRVAVKIIRSQDKYIAAARNEIRILSTLMSHDPHGDHQVVRMLHWFDFIGAGHKIHVVMVFPLLGKSMYHTMSVENYRKPFHIDIIRTYIKQILETVGYMHALGIIHTDIKPENVLHNSEKYVRSNRSLSLASYFPESSKLTLIDFGSSVFEDAPHAKLVSTRHYRAPEIVLGLSWSKPIDIWSIGCFIMELVVGKTFFATSDNAEHLLMIEAAIGPVPDVMWNDRIELCEGWKERSYGHRIDMKSLKNYFNARINQSLSSSDPATKDLLDLVQRMLCWIPSERISCREALHHAFFHPLN
jgi:dual-specificity kinase